MRCAVVGGRWYCVVAASCCNIPLVVCAKSLQYGTVLIGGGVAWRT